jgi:hypothetical protein
MKDVTYVHLISCRYLMMLMIGDGGERIRR